MWRTNRYLLSSATLILGGIFTLSGVLKIADPWGGAAKIEEYLSIYSLEWLAPVSMWIAVVLSACEMAMGLLLILRVYLKPLSTIYLCALSLFTIITLLSATTHPIGDCGCFGEVIKLTPWQTFSKNVVLLLISVVLFIDSRSRDFKINLRDNITLAIVSVLSLSFAIYVTQSMPLIDATPYRIGVNLYDELYGQPSEQIAQPTLIYRNIETGKLHEFDLSDSEWHDSSLWEWVETRSDIPSEGSDIVDFALFNSDQIDITRSVVEADIPTTIFIVKGVDKLSQRCQSWINREIERGSVNGSKSYIINPRGIALSGQASQTETLSLDYTTLKTLLRPSVGSVTIVDGVITEKKRCR